MDKKALYILLILLLIFSCKKDQYRYPEDGGKSTLTPNDRLGGGWWKLDDYTFNGNSIVAKLNSPTNNKYNIKSIQFSYGYLQDSKNWHLLLTGGTYLYQDDNKAFSDFHYLVFGSCSDTIFNKWLISPFHFLQNTATSWSVTELYNKDLHLILSTDSGEYKIFWKKN